MKNGKFKSRREAKIGQRGKGWNVTRDGGRSSREKNDSAQRIENHSKSEDGEVPIGEIDGENPC